MKNIWEGIAMRIILAMQIVLMMQTILTMPREAILIMLHLTPIHLNLAIVHNAATIHYHYLNLATGHNASSIHYHSSPHRSLDCPSSIHLAAI